MALPKTSYITMSLEVGYGSITLYGNSYDYKRPDADDADIEYHRNKAKSQKFKQTFHSNIQTLQYLEPPDIHEFLNEIAFIKNSLGGRFNFEVVGNSTEGSSLFCQTDGVTSVTTTGSDMLPFPVQATANPYTGSLASPNQFDLNEFNPDFGRLDNDDSWAALLNIPTVPDVESADLQQADLSDYAGGATHKAVLPSDLTKASMVDQATSYPTPSTICYSSPSTQMRENAYASPATNSHREGGTARRKRKRTAGVSPVIGSNPVVHMLLKSCVFRKGQRSAKNGSPKINDTEILDDKQITRVLQVGARLVSNDMRRSLRSHLENWERNQSQNLYALGIPFQWQGIEVAAEYFIKIGTDNIADLVGTRVAPLLFFINYDVMWKRPEEFCSRPRKKGEQKKTLVLSCIVDKIVDKIPGYFSDQQSPKARRDLVNNQIRHGRWWWKLSRRLGLGILLLGSEDLFRNMRNDTFSNAQIDALRTYASYARPGTIRLLQSLNPVVRTVIFGRIPRDLVNALQSDGSPLFGDSELRCASNEDEAALANLNPQIPWVNAVPEDEDQEDVLKVLYNRVEENF